jgi:hypothetical protein
MFRSPILIQVSRSMLYRHPGTGRNTILCRAESLARAPNLRLKVVRLAMLSATKLGSKRYQSRHIELSRMLRPFWLLNCHIGSRPAGRIKFH